MAAKKVQLLCCAALIVTAAYSQYASFLKICMPWSLRLPVS